jgi:hypothetical protein
VGPGELQKLRIQLRQSFREFVRWHLLNEKKTPVDINLAMADFLERPSRIKLLLAARGFSKSTLGIYYAAWRLLRVPSTKVHFVSHADHEAASLAIKLLDFLRTSPIMSPLAPGKGVSKSNYQIRYSIAERDRSVSCSGIKGSRTGKRADLIIADDAECPTNSTSALLREELLAAMGELPKLLHDQLRLLKVSMNAGEWEKAKPQLDVLPENTQIIYLGTYQTTESVYIVPDNLGEGGHPLKLADIGKFPALLPDGTAAWPEKFPLEELEFRKASDTHQNWLLHYMLDATPVGDDYNPIVWERIQKYEMKPRVLTCYMDPTGSSTREKQAMETAVCWAASCEGKVYIDDLMAWRSQDSFVTYGLVVDECMRRGVNKICIEGQQPTEAQVMKRVVADKGARIQVETFGIGNQNKETRVAQALEVAINSGCLVFHPRVLLDARTRDQLKKVRANSLPRPCDRVDLIGSVLNQLGGRIGAAYKFQAYHLRTGS